MLQQASKEFLVVLLQAYNRPVKDYFYFPEVVLAGNQRIDPDVFAALLADGYLQCKTSDSFGRIYQLSPKGEEALFSALSLKPGRRRKKPAGPEFQPFLF